MDIFKMNEEQKEEYFKDLGIMCNNICNDNVIQEGERDWTQEDIDLFVSQFQQSQEDVEEPIIDMSKLDPHFLPYEKYQKKYSGFDEEVIRTMWELDNKKLEDLRIPPLQINHEKVELIDNLSTIRYIEDGEKKNNTSVAETKTEAEAECVPKTESDANCEGCNSPRKDKKEEEEN